MNNVDDLLQFGAFQCTNRLAELLLLIERQRVIVSKGCVGILLRFTARLAFCRSVGSSCLRLRLRSRFGG